MRHRSLLVGASAVLALFFLSIALLAYLGEDSERLKTGLLWVTGVSVLLFGACVWWDRKQNKQK